MSLLIVGSCSRVTQNIVKLLAQRQQYQNITILDLLPLYDFHLRFYNLQKHLKSTNSNTKVTLNKLFRPEDLAANINNHKDLLFVTHDYFQSVTSKTKLMDITAKLSSSVSLSSFRKIQSSQHLLSMIILELMILKQNSINLRKKFSK